MKTGNKDFWLKRLFRSNLFFLLALLILFLFSYALFRETMRKLEIQKEIKNLEEKVVTLENRNKELSSLIAYLKTDQYIEMEARTKLGYKKPGETVVAVASHTVASSGDDPALASTGNLSKSNWQLWLDYFFN